MGDTMRTVWCDYCDTHTDYVDSEEIYGKSYGMIYLCRSCGAYVGVHRGTDIPLGRLANAELRDWKKMAHANFDPVWTHGRFKGRRSDAYKWLADQMGLPEEETHIGMFNVKQCQQLIMIMDFERDKNYGKY